MAGLMQGGRYALGLMARCATVHRLRIGVDSAEETETGIYNRGIPLPGASQKSRLRQRLHRET